ncbi:LysR family transcriptional regulator [Paralcaligenes sp. KSB-10]|uniref:LysR family transcriptional regulator n=1 Tax=Paralcaligenes sp. KSB-10 TaxID=2901142 RepID=UPI001E3ABB31|nr:LysR family transcriptional regulator [Paralcaligenes sp. KSB-10]UHL65080.1 LysR family transcriptional regulator [Paralcaligenes sp. KSB-10]
MNLNLRDIEYFLAVAESGHMGRAAAACAVTQPALSKSIHRLEDETGLKLFDRSARSMRLTSSGLAFVEHARRLKLEYLDTVRHAGELRMGQAGLLRVGATGATLDNVVMPALAVLLPRRPALKVCVTVGLSDALCESVGLGDLDMAVAPIYGAGPTALERVVLGEDSLEVVVRDRHALLDKPRLQLSDLLDFSWILPGSQASARKALFGLFEAKELGLPNVAMEVEFISEGTLAVVAATDLISFAPMSLLRRLSTERVVPLPLRLPLRLPRQISLLTHRGVTWTPLMEAFRQVLADQINPRR